MHKPLTNLRSLLSPWAATLNGLAWRETSIVLSATLLFVLMETYGSTLTYLRNPWLESMIPALENTVRLLGWMVPCWLVLWIPLSWRNRRATAREGARRLPHVWLLSLIPAVLLALSLGTLLPEFYNQGLFPKWIESPLKPYPIGMAGPALSAHEPALLVDLLRPLGEYLYWFASSLVFYFAIPLALVVTVLRERPRDFGLGLGDTRTGLLWTGAAFLVMLPVLYLCSRHPVFKDLYPFDKGALAAPAVFLTYELLYAGYFIGWEFILRGFLLFGLHRRFGPWAILIQLMPFVLLKIDKPMEEILAAFIAGFLLAMLALRTKSIWYGALLHILCALSLDWMIYMGT